MLVVVNSLRDGCIEVRDFMDELYLSKIRGGGLRTAKYPGVARLRALWVNYQQPTVSRRGGG